MKPIVAIIGRPNTGKSTLFNKIVKKRIAIVDPTPGVTRDRHYAQVKYNNKPFIIVDTGGFIPDCRENEGILSLMKEQVEIAIEEADSIIFLMDGKEGLNDYDIAISNMLREVSKKVFYVINKIDNKESKNNIYDFYRLGIDDFKTISAEHNIGIEDLLIEITKDFTEEKDIKLVEDKIHIAFIGKPNVGKSSLINRIIGYNRFIVDSAPGTTRDSIDTLFEFKGKHYILIDTAGIRRKSKVEDKVEKFSIIKSIQSIYKSDVVLIIIDSKEGISEQDKKIAGIAHEEGKGIIIVVNKWDLMEGTNSEDDKQKKYKENLYNELKYLQYAPVIFVSALTGKNVKQILKVAEDIFHYRNLRIPTHSLNKVLQDAVEKFSPPIIQNKRYNFYYITQIKSAPPTFIIFTNHSTKIHFAYERYLKNSLREAFIFEGNDIKLIFRCKSKKKHEFQN